MPVITDGATRLPPTVDGTVLPRGGRIGPAVLGSWYGESMRPPQLLMEGALEGAILANNARQGGCRQVSRKFLAGVGRGQAGDAMQPIHVIARLLLHAKTRHTPSSTHICQEKFLAGVSRCHKRFWQVSAGGSRPSGRY